jgi:dTDP-4-dehydrorhamnose 3,5-epimerase
VIFLPTPLAGARLIELERRADERGFFARTWCRREMEQAGLDPRLAQCSLSHNQRRGILRGMHWQASPHGEVKLVRCTRGAIWDVIIDLRPESPSYTQHFGVELSEANGRTLYIPEGFAHGFQTLTDIADVYYQMSVEYHPDSARGLRWNDPRFGIEWPIADPFLHPRDAAYPDYPVGEPV